MSTKSRMYSCDSGHPRVGGEHRTNMSQPSSNHGSSPRGRGTYGRTKVHLVRGRVIPAWAGNMRQVDQDVPFRPGHPRVGGEHIPTIRTSGFPSGSSPAWAGNIRVLNAPRHPEPGHPRVGGEHKVDPMAAVLSDGSSPRGRGTYIWALEAYHASRVIPAWAGNIPGRIRRRGFCPGHPRVGGEHTSL